MLLPFGYYVRIIDKQSDIRIFNHPKLKNWFKKNFQNIDQSRDIFAYNGFDYDEIVKLIG